MNPDDTRMLRCRLSLMKRTACLQTILLTKDELAHLQQAGPEAFSYELFPAEVVASVGLSASAIVTNAFNA